MLMTHSPKEPKYSETFISILSLVDLNKTRSRCFHQFPAGKSLMTLIQPTLGCCFGNNFDTFQLICLIDSNYEMLKLESGCIIRSGTVVVINQTKKRKIMTCSFTAFGLILAAVVYCIGDVRCSCLHTRPYLIG